MPPQLALLLEDEDLRFEAMDAVRSLIDHIEVHPGNKRGKCSLVLVGALAGILAFATNKNTTREGGTNLLVAGARNQLNLLFSSRTIVAR